MKTAAFDTLEFAKRLKAVDFSELQAETPAQVMAGMVYDQLATKNDLQEMEMRLEAKLEAKLASLKTDLIKWIIGLFLANSPCSSPSLKS